MKIYCINLARSTDRRQRMQTQFEQQSLPFEFINAVDGRLLWESQLAAVYSKWRTRLCHGKDLSQGEIGCVLSHMEFYRRVAEDDSSGFVFEDDVEIGVETKSALGKVQAFLDSAKSPCLVQLPGLERDLPHRNNIYPAESFVKVASAMGTYAYGVNPSAATLLLKAFTPVKFPIDYYGYLVKHHGLYLYVYNNKVISVDMASESTVGDDRFRVYKGVKWLSYKAWRLIGKTVDRFLIGLGL